MSSLYAVTYEVICGDSLTVIIPGKSDVYSLLAADL